MRHGNGGCYQWAYLDVAIAPPMGASEILVIATKQHRIGTQMKDFGEFADRSPDIHC